MKKRFSFHPGETVVLNFVIPFSLYDVKAVVVSFRNNDRVAFEAIATSFKQEGDDPYKTRVGFTLTQAESLQFDENSIYMMQLNVFGPNSSRIVSDEIKLTTGAQQLVEPGFGGDGTYAYHENYGQASETDEGEVISYNDLADRPKINSVTLEGNRILPEESITIEQIEEITSN